jgi:predicted NACHT family NTPase
MPEIDIQTNLPGGWKETTRVKSLQELFTPSKKVLQEIYLSAIAGFGKTSFSKYLAITWCQAHKKDENYKHFKDEELEALSGFEFLFLLLLRDSAKVCDIDGMIEQQVIQYLPCSSSMPKEFLKGLVSDILHDEKCLVILDGLDEWSHPDNDCTKIPKSIPHQYAREKCVILTTTRPWKLGASDLKTYQISKTVELVKMNKHNVRQFTLNAMKILKATLKKKN